MFNDIPQFLRNLTKEKQTNLHLKCVVSLKLNRHKYDANCKQHHQKLRQGFPMILDRDIVLWLCFHPQSESDLKFFLSSDEDFYWVVIAM